jgi:iron-sulfur cluster assembly protein
MTTQLLTAPPETTPGVINLTPAAIRKAREILAREGDPDDLYLRMGVKGGGCSGFSYVLEFDRDVDPSYDRFFEFDGVKVVVDRKSLLFLAGTTLDYSGDLHIVGESGFEFRNPNVKRSCGCGTSFQV